MISIEKVTKQDTKALLSIYSHYVTDTAVSFEYDVPSEAEFASRIETISQKFPYIKATLDGEIVGYAYATTYKARAAYDHAVETTIYIDPDHRRCGIGKVLYTALEHALRAMGITNLNACIATLPEGQSDPHLTNDSLCFHAKMGYKMVGTFHGVGYKFGQWYDMSWMEKMIGEHTTPAPPVKIGEWKLQ